MTGGSSAVVTAVCCPAVRSAKPADPSCVPSVQPALPVPRHPTLGAGRGLVERAPVRPGQLRPAGIELIVGVVPEPRLAGFEAAVPPDAPSRPRVPWRAGPATSRSSRPGPQAAHRRRWNHHPPEDSHSTQPGPLGGTSGATPTAVAARMLGLIYHGVFLSTRRYGTRTRPSVPCPGSPGRVEPVARPTPGHPRGPRLDPGIRSPSGGTRQWPSPPHSPAGRRSSSSTARSPNRAS